MRILVDTREKAPWTFGDERDVVTQSAKLAAGDYSVEGLHDRVAVERKSLEDWIGTVIRDRQRFYRELALLRSYEFRCVIVESGVREIVKHEYRSQVPPSAVLGFVAEVTVAQSVPVYLAGSRAEAQILAAAFLRMAEKKLRATEKVSEHDA